VPNPISRCGYMCLTCVVVLRCRKAGDGSDGNCDNGADENGGIDDDWWIGVNDDSGGNGSGGKISDDNDGNDCDGAKEQIGKMSDGTTVVAVEKTALEKNVPKLSWAKCENVTFVVRFRMTSGCGSKTISTSVASKGENVTDSVP